MTHAAARQQGYTQELLDELSEVRLRNSKLEADLAIRRNDLEDLQLAINAEHEAAQEILTEQRWLVPRVASVLESGFTQPPPRRASSAASSRARSSKARTCLASPA